MGTVIVRCAGCLLAFSTVMGNALVAEANKSDQIAAYREAVTAFKAGRWSDALARFEVVGKKSSGYLQLCATNMVGQIHRIEGRPIEARAAFAEVHRQAQAFAQSGRVDGPEVRRTTLLGRLALHYQAEICEQQQAWRDAIVFYEQLRSLDSGGESRVESAASLSPWFLERLARLYWRVGEPHKARETFDQLLVVFPDYERSPLIQLSLLSLTEVSLGRDERALDCFICPMAQQNPGLPMSTKATSPEATSLPSLPKYVDMASSHLNRLLDKMPVNNRWRWILLFEKGWMQFEVGRFNQAASVFNEVADGASHIRGDWARRVRDYAALSSAVCCMRQGRYADGLKIAQEVTERGPQGHVQTLAVSLINSLGRRMQETKAGAKCELQTLK